MRIVDSGWWLRTVPGRILQSLLLMLHQDPQSLPACIGVPPAGGDTYGCLLVNARKRCNMSTPGGGEITLQVFIPGAAVAESDVLGFDLLVDSLNLSDRCQRQPLPHLVVVATTPLTL